MIKLEIEYNNGTLSINGNMYTCDAEIIEITPLIVREIVRNNASRISIPNENANIYAMVGVCIDELRGLEREILNETHTRE